MQFMVQRTGYLAVALVVLAVSAIGAETWLQKHDATMYGQAKPAGQVDNATAVRDIFYVPDGASVTNGQSLKLAVKYKILLKRDDFVGFVPADFQFKSGDSFRLYVETNAGGELYITNEGSSGKTHLLFPDPRINNGRHTLKAHQETVVPGIGWYRFDDTPGIEKVHIFLAAKKNDTLANLAQAAVTANNPTVTDQAWQSVVTDVIDRRTRGMAWVDEGQSVVAPQTVQPEHANVSSFSAVEIPPTAKDKVLVQTISLSHDGGTKAVPDPMMLD